jgi:hypothetical protein
MFRILAAQYRRVGGHSVIGLRDPDYSAVANGVQTGYNYCELGHDCRQVRSHRRSDATRLVRRRSC